MKKKRYYIGVDVGGTYTKIALVDGKGRLIAREVLETADYGRNELIDRIINSIEKKFLSARDLKKTRVTGIGVGLPGLIDSRRGVVRYLVNIPGWENVRLKRIFESRLGIKTYVDNDVNLMALGEFYHGRARAVNNLICITLGTGVGGGIIIHGKLYHGRDMAAGEIGHIPINEKGPKCNCGGRGCIEAYIGNRYMSKRLRTALKREKSIIKKFLISRKAPLTPELLTEAARKGDSFAIRFWEDVGTKLGVMLTGVVNLLNPEVIVIGGGIANAGRFLFDPLEKTVKKRAMKIQAKSVKIVKTKLGGDAGVIGAAVLAKISRTGKT